ncbi:MAG: T9SS type A sorting domain-containing protein [Gelidibacter sp.]|uniref:T9SS type A sorting domain-containing protein n=1 Tax=Gelidibacter sp. TaxID=2018083 RepID=UPI0032645E0C
MKKHILFFVLTFLLGLFTTYSQESLTHKIVEYYDSDTQVYSEALKEEYTYNSKGELAETKDFYWLSIAWIPASKIQYTYDNNGNLTETVFSSWNDFTKAYTNIFRDVLTYTNNKIIQEITYTWDNGVWKPEDKTDFVYSGNNIASFNSFEWNGTLWINDERGVVNYVANKISEIIIEDFENNIWVLSDKTIYKRNASSDRIEEILFQTWEGVAWKNDDKINFTTDTSGNRITEIYSKSPDGIIWEENDKIDYTYDKTILLSKYRNPFNTNSYQNDAGLDDIAHYNKLLTSITSENTSAQIPVRGAATWEIETRSTYYYSDDTMDLNDLSDSNFVSVYPNPTTNMFNIKLRDQIQADASLFDINGRKVLEKKIQALNTSLNIEALNAGIYVLKIYSDNGFATKRITKN